jgi:hypothetical protein
LRSLTTPAPIRATLQDSYVPERRLYPAGSISMRRINKLCAAPVSLAAERLPLGKQELTLASSRGQSPRGGTIYRGTLD